MKNYYKLLRVPVFSEPHVIKKSFINLAKEYHPDKNKGSHFFNDYFAEIKESYDFLMDPEKKQKYDDLIRNNPEFIEVVDLVVSKKDVSFFSNKKYNYYINYKFIFTVLSVVLLSYLIFNYSPMSDMLDNKNVISNSDSNKVTQESKSSIQNNTQVTDNNLKLNDENEQVTSRKSINKIDRNYRDMVSAEVNDNSIIIINKNNFEIFRVDLEITYMTPIKEHTNLYDPTLKWTSGGDIEKEYKSFFNIAPGVRTVYWTTDNSRRMWVKLLSCEKN
jgi:curved DNA-binding protein CbpA